MNWIAQMAHGQNGTFVLIDRSTADANLILITTADVVNGAYKNIQKKVWLLGFQNNIKINNVSCQEP